LNTEIRICQRATHESHAISPHPLFCRRKLRHCLLQGSTGGAVFRSFPRPHQAVQRRSQDQVRAEIPTPATRCGPRQILLHLAPHRVIRRLPGVPGNTSRFLHHLAPHRVPVIRQRPGVPGNTFRSVAPSAPASSYLAAPWQLSWEHDILGAPPRHGHAARVCGKRGGGRGEGFAKFCQVKIRVVPIFGNKAVFACH
jgi:hypothetical protein